MVEHINQVLNKLVAVGADADEVWYYSMPSWWTPEMNTNWLAISEAAAILSNIYQIPAGRLLDPESSVQLFKPLNDAILDYTKLLLQISGIKTGKFYFSPTQTEEFMTKSKNNPTITSKSIDWSMYSVNDLVFLEKVLNIQSTLQ